MTDDYGTPIGYPVLAEGTPVRTSDGQEAGWVKRVLADEGTDIFHSIVVRTRDGNRAVPAADVEALYERCVVLGIDAAAVDALPEHDAVEE
jgi:PRC-barrel domain